MREDEKNARDLYDLQSEVYGQGSIDQMNAEIPEFINIIKKNSLLKGNILDIGVGTGQLSLALLKSIKRNAAVFGFDISANNVSEFKSHANEEPRIADAKVASFYDIPYEDNSFELAVSNHVLHYAEDLNAALKQIRKKMTPGGHLIFTSVVCQKGNSENKIHGVLVHEKIDKPIKVWAYQRSKEEILNALNNAGFAVLPTDKGSYFKEYWPEYYYHRSEKVGVEGATPHTFLVTAKAVDTVYNQTWDHKFPEGEFKLQADRLSKILEQRGFEMKSQSKFWMPLFYKSIPNARGMFGSHTLVMSSNTTYEDRFFFFLNGLAHVLQWNADPKRKEMSFHYQETYKNTKDIKGQYEHKLDSLGYLLQFMFEHGFERYILWYLNYFKVDQKYLRDYVMDIKEDINFDYFQSLLTIGDFLEMPESTDTTLLTKSLPETLEISEDKDKFIYFV
jgi:ubiquinone/menaquinone biosynthesis C-methylase UbiE